MRFIGLDLSLTATGWYSDDGAGELRAQGRLPARASEYERAVRLGLIARTIKRVCGVSDLAQGHPPRADLVILEGYSFGSSNQREHMGELGGVVKLELVKAGVPFVVVPPSVLKKYATGRGNAPKDEVLAAAVRRSERVTTNNVADAFWLWAMAAYIYSEGRGHPIPLMPVRNVGALAKVAWPALGPEADIMPMEFAHQ